MALSDIAMTQNCCYSHAVVACMQCTIYQRCSIVLGAYWCTSAYLKDLLIVVNWRMMYVTQGATSRLVITPLTDRCWLTITGAYDMKVHL
jgi:Hydrolytic ATP binding site of dynein motor region